MNLFIKADTNADLAGFDTGAADENDLEKYRKNLFTRWVIQGEAFRRDDFENSLVVYLVLKKYLGKSEKLRIRNAE